MQAMARQVEDQSHEESEPWSTSKPLAKLGKVGKAISSKMEGNRAFRKAKSSNSQGVPKFGRVCQILAGCAKFWQGVPKFHRVCQTFSGCAKITLCAPTIKIFLQNCNFSFLILL